MVQGGDDPTGTRRGGESVYGGKFEDEITRNLKFVGARVVAMANPGTPNSNGSQFFITLKPTPFLDGKHTQIVFGDGDHSAHGRCSDTSFANRSIVIRVAVIFVCSFDVDTVEFFIIVFFIRYAWRPRRRVLKSPTVTFMTVRQREFMLGVEQQRRSVSNTVPRLIRDTDVVRNDGGSLHCGVTPGNSGIFIEEGQVPIHHSNISHNMAMGISCMASLASLKGSDVHCNGAQPFRQSRRVWRVL